MDLSLSAKEPKNPVFFVRRKPVAVEHENVFDLAWRSFEWLVSGPDPVAVDGRAIEGLPRRLLPLDELGTALLARSCSQSTRDAAWRYLVTRSRAEGGTWTVACTGLALPVLLPVARSLTREFAGDRDDVYSAILTGFLDGLREVDLDRPAILVRLRWTAYRAGARTVREALDRPRPREDLGFRSAPPVRAGSHPDLVLAAAVEAGAISAAEASLISATRLGELSLAEAAQSRGQTYEAAKRARLRAEARLLAHLAADTDNSRTHRARRRGAQRRVSRTDAKSGVSRRGSHAPADRAHPPRRTATRSDVPTTRKVR
ncbi:sigma-70 family RNA polymerase sigma factor [Amycolatopsis sp. NPDC006125]|uniref:sigma-70 family RNA polymerase sigma factor n=1 Tax=Amycolatopsis sp. NPDC006125 TaxID=3156730 RepID=UPI0033AD3BC8